MLLFTQDSIDFFLGNYVIPEGEGLVIPSPLDTSRGWKYGTVSTTKPLQLSSFAQLLSLYSSHLFLCLPWQCSLLQQFCLKSTTRKIFFSCCFGVQWLVLQLPVFSDTARNSSIGQGFGHQLILMPSKYFDIFLIKVHKFVSLLSFFEYHKNIAKKYQFNNRIKFGKRRKLKFQISSQK